METFVCHICTKEKPIQKEGGTGYGMDKDGKIVCYDCCGHQDRLDLKNLDKGKKVLHYYDGKNVTNWPGTMKIKPFATRNGKHNIAGTRTDVWFVFEGNNYHGVNYGNNSQILHIKKTI